MASVIKSFCPEGTVSKSFPTVMFSSMIRKNFLKILKYKFIACSVLTFCVCFSEYTFYVQTSWNEVGKMKPFNSGAPSIINYELRKFDA